ncbi:hypothetical protein J1N35_011281 [Gossypium stocksii]|uniref:Uncharacterized protein n=1 Tax=Gossypium stocksii TaxID=47602 RepID=A0A9D3W360_9ROSI|nr:hypothetical protein J1N35_011281 [Gossypium stocksii]
MNNVEMLSDEIEYLMIMYLKVVCNDIETLVKFIVISMERTLCKCDVSVRVICLKEMEYLQRSLNLAFTAKKYRYLFYLVSILIVAGELNALVSTSPTTLFISPTITMVGIQLKGYKYQLPKILQQQERVTYEGTSQVKKFKVEIFTLNYETFKIKPEEDIKTMSDQFTIIINELKSYGKTYPNEEVSWKSKVIAIEEVKNLETFSLDELISSLLTHEMRIKEGVEEEEKVEKNKVGITLKYTIEEGDSSDDLDEDKEMTMFARQFKRFMRSNRAIGLHFYPIWEAASVDEWLYNGGPYELIVLHFLLGVACYMGREWELSFRLGMRPWIAVAYSAPVAAATAVFLIYPIGQGSFSDVLCMVPW